MSSAQPPPNLPGTSPPLPTPQLRKSKVREEEEAGRGAPEGPGHFVLFSTFTWQGCHGYWLSRKDRTGAKHEGAGGRGAGPAPRA